MQTRLLFAHALSPLHAGTGQSVGAIDLSIARDRATDMPYCPSSSLKGSLRSLAEGDDRPGKGSTTWALFGPDTEHAHEHAGALAFGDANLLLLPVRSIAGTFAWVTSRFLLGRFARDAREAGLDGLPPLPTTDLDISTAAVTDGTALRVGKQVVFEDLDLTPDTPEWLPPWAEALGELLFADEPFWQAHLGARLCTFSLCTGIA